MNVARGSCLSWPAKGPPFSAGASQEPARTNRCLHLAEGGEQSSTQGWSKFNSLAERVGLVDCASSWTSASVRDGRARSPLDRAAESRSLEESFRVVVPVASWF